MFPSVLPSTATLAGILASDGLSLASRPSARLSGSVEPIQSEVMRINMGNPRCFLLD